MLQWCADNLDSMEVSLNVGLFSYSLYITIYTQASHALHEYGRNVTAINIHLDDVSCTGTETKLADCLHRGVGNHNCRPGIDNAAVICTGKHKCYFIALPRCV